VTILFWPKTLYYVWTRENWVKWKRHDGHKIKSLLPLIKLVVIGCQCAKSARTSYFFVL